MTRSVGVPQPATSQLSLNASCQTCFAGVVLGLAHQQQRSHQNPNHGQKHQASMVVAETALWGCRGQVPQILGHLGNRLGGTSALRCWPSVDGTSNRLF